MISKIRFIIWGLSYVFSALFFIPAMAITKSRNRPFRRFWCQGLIVPFGIKVQIEGAPDPEAKMFASNHRSFLDIVLLEAIVPSSIDMAWIAKQQLMKTPVIGWMLRAGRMIPIERENKRGVIKMLKAMKEPLEEGRTIVIFPEGTRSK